MGIENRRLLITIARTGFGQVQVPLLGWARTLAAYDSGCGSVFAFAVPNLITGHAIDHAEAAPDGSRRRVEAMSARCRQTRGREKHDAVLFAILDDDPAHGARTPGRPDRLRSRGHHGLHVGLIPVEERGYRCGVGKREQRGNGRAITGGPR